jgi:hypothetical protein
MEIPAEFICPLCKGLLAEAVLLPCCAIDVCEECGRSGLTTSFALTYIADDETKISRILVLLNIYLLFAFKMALKILQLDF